MPSLHKLLFWGCLMACTAGWGATTKVTYPAYETTADSRFNDLIEILQTALEKTESDF